MEYGLMFNMGIFESPVVIVYEGKETRYTDGSTAGANARFSKPVIVGKVQARDNEIIVYVEENTKHNDTSWAKDEDISFF